MSKCTVCNGTGKLNCTYCRDGKCELCNGYGTINRGVYAPGGSEGGKITCSKCGGTGQCSHCNGTRFVYCGACGGTGN